MVKIQEQIRKLAINKVLNDSKQVKVPEELSLDQSTVPAIW